MAERVAVWKIAADFTKVRREAKKTREELERLQDTREDTTKEHAAASKDMAKADDVAAKAAGRNAAVQNKSLSVFGKLSRAKREAAAATRELTQAEREEINASDSVVNASNRVAQALNSRSRANLALEASQRRLAAVEAQHGVESQKYADALLSVQRKTLEADAADRRHIDTVRRHSSVVKEIEQAMRAAGAGAGGLASAVTRTAGSFGRAATSTKVFGFALKGLGILGIVSAIGGLLVSLSQLSAGLVAVIGPITRVAGVMAALPQFMTVAAGAIGTFIGAFSGIGEALKAGTAAQTGATQAAKDGAAANKAAAEAARQAARQVILAERGVQDALEATRDAHEALIEAREEERRRIRDLKDDLESLALAERGAALSVEEAQRRLNEVMLDPGSDQLAKDQAQLALDEALNAMDQVKKERRRAKKENKEATEDGIEGSDSVQDALEAEKDANVALADANYALAEAHRAQATAGDQAAESMVAAAAGANAYQDALNKLSPAGRDFVMLLMSMKDELKILKFAAQEGLLPGLGQALTILTKLVPLVAKGLHSFGEIIGATAVQGAKMVTSGPFTAMFERLLTSNEKILRRAGKTLLNFVAAIIYLMDAARPFTNWLSKTILQFSKFTKESAKAGNQNGGIASYLEKTKRVLEILGKTFGNLWGTFKNIGRAGDNLGMDLLRSFQRITKGWEKWTGSMEGQSQLREWFDAARPALHEFRKLLGAIMRGFFDLGRTSDISPIIKQIRTEMGPAIYDIIKNLQGPFGQAISDIVTSILEIFASLTDAGGGGLTTFAQTVAGFFKTVSKAAENDSVTKVITGIASALGLFAALNFIAVILGLKSLFKLLGKIIGIGSKVGKFAMKFKPIMTIVTNLRWAFLAFAGPLAIAIGIIAALVAVGVLLYRKWQPFKQIVDEVASFLKDKLVAAAKDVWKMIKSDLIPAFQDLVAALKPSDKTLKGIKDALEKYVLPAMKVVAKFMGGHFISTIKNTLKAIIGIITGIVKVITGMINVVRGIMTGDWDRVWKGAKQIFSGFWDALKGIIRAVTSPIVSLFDGLVGAMGKSWDKLKAKLASPIEFVINTVIDSWLIDNVNDLLGAIGIDTNIPHVGPVKFARGGSVPGQGNRDSVPALLTPGEFVLRKDAVKSIGVSNLSSMNEGRSRKPSRYGFGDIVGAAAGAGSDLWDSASGAVSNAVSGTWGTVTNAAGQVIDMAKVGASKGLQMLLEPLRGKLNGIGDAWFFDDVVKKTGNTLFDMAIAWVGGAKAASPFKNVPPPRDTPVATSPQTDALDDSSARVSTRGRSKRILKYARGGQVGSVNALLTPGEFVMGRDAVQRIGVNRLRTLNRSGNGGSRALGRFARGGLFQGEGLRKIKRNKKYPDSPGDMISPVQKFHSGGPVNGFQKGARGTHIKALEALVGTTMDGSWNKNLQQRLKAPGVLDNPAWLFPHDGEKDAKFLKWIQDADVKKAFKTEKHTVLGGETVADVLKAAYGKQYTTKMKSFLEANNFYKETKTKVESGGSAALNKALGFARAQNGKPYIWGGVGPGGYDCSGYQSAITNVLKNRAPHSRLFATGSMASALPGLGFRGGLGSKTDYSVGWYTGDPGHTAGTLGSLNVESTGDHVRNGADARGAGAFPNKMHLPLGAGSSVKIDKKALYDLNDKLKEGTVVKLPNVPFYEGARKWGEAKSKYGASDNQMVTWIKELGKGFSGIAPKFTSGLKFAYTENKGLLDGAMTALNTRLGLPALKSKYGGDTKKAMSHILDHSFGQEHDPLKFRPWAAWTPLEAAIIQQMNANAKQQQWEGALTTLSTWGLTDLVESLFEQGVDDDAAFNTAMEAAQNQQLATMLNEQIKAAGKFSQDDIENIIKLIGYLQSANPAPGLRDVARQLELSDYRTVKLWEDGNRAGKFNSVPTAKRSRLDNDIASYRQGTYYFAEGGEVPGGGNRDSVPAMLTPGEFVLKKEAAKALGLNNLWALNGLQKFATGGLVMAPSVSAIPTNARAGVSTRRMNQAAAAGGTNITYDVEINNPVAEPSTRTMTKMLQRQAALKGNQTEA